MRKTLLYILVFVMALGAWQETHAQLNKVYFFRMGRGFLINNRYEDAIETLNIMLKADPEAYEGYFLRGIAKYNLDDLMGAEMDFSQAIEKNPVFTTAFQYRAITRSRLGNYDDALNDFREAIDLRPDLPGPYYSRGVTYLLSQQFDKAVADFDKFIRHENKVADAYINRGTAYLNLKDTTRAFDDYNRAIQTNRENPDGYVRRGMLYMARKNLDGALADFNKAIEYDSTHIPSYFNKAMVYAQMKRPAQSIENFDHVLALDSTSSLTYFNRAILRSQIGDYNRALEDYDKVVKYSPNNVLVYYNRAALELQLGDLEAAVKDYTKAISLYPDFANAYLARGQVKYLLGDVSGSRKDKSIAEKKIAEYRSKLTDSAFSVYADTSKRFNALLSFNADMGAVSGDVSEERPEVSLQPLFRFSLIHPDTIPTINPHRYYLQRVEDFKAEVGNPLLQLTCKASDISNDSLFVWNKRLADSLERDGKSWRLLFGRSVTQALVRQFTGAINNLNSAINLAPANPFLYLNRSTTQSEMIDFISSIDNSYHRITVDSDPVNQLKNNSVRMYNYDAAIADLNKAAKLFPEFAHIYYNRGNLQCLSGNMAEALSDYSKAIALNPHFAEAYYNRGLVQIYLKDTRKGFIDISKAGELGIREAYTVLKKYRPKSID